MATSGAKKRDRTSLLFETDGLSDIRINPSLFNPLGTKKISSSPRCAAHFSPDRLVSDRTDRLREIPPPPGGLRQVLKRLQTIGGVGKAGPLTSLNFTSGVTLNSAGDPQGPVNVLEKISEMALYSRAAGARPFLPAASLDDVYNLLGWRSYLKNVLGTDNVRAAAKGAVAAHAVLEALRPRQADGSEASVTIFVGHDSDLLALATALGLRWKLGPPYDKSNSKEYLITPPGSGMHFVHDFERGEVELSYIYPVYLTQPQKTNSTYHLNQTGILEAVPMSLHNAGLEYNRPTNKTSNVVSNGMHILDQRLQATFDKYPEALECYMIFKNQSDAATLNAASGYKECPRCTEKSSSIIEVPLSYVYYFLPISLVVIGFFFFLLNKTRNRIPQHQYQMVNITNAVI